MTWPADWGLDAVLADVTAERDAALAAVERVKALHVVNRQGSPETYRCGHDGLPWPCPTIRALEQP